MSATPAATSPAPSPAVLDALRRFWGYDTLRPLQAEAIRAGLEQRDSLVVLPTGGGKSLCYQIPAVVAGKTDVVVSPLIALMKDQVDGLVESDYPAAALHSNLSLDQQREIEQRMAAGEYRLIFVAPERVLTSRFLDLLRAIRVRAFAIDEAHCISQWGHDFRPEYRQLAQLKTLFPKSSMHAYTATATPRVRDDIIAQLRLRDPHVLVGVFDRPNLVYRILPRTDPYTQTLEAIQRHAGQAVIVYCLSRKDTEEMASYLRSQNIKAAHYHAGMTPDQRRRTQDLFAEERLDVIAATVAFGMGIDRSDVRCIIHATMPKTVEHYQQETGRAGRDGLEAECILLYSSADIWRWDSLIALSAENAENPAQVMSAMKSLLTQMQKLCSTAQCRHKALSEYFGQSYTKASCAACDVCLSETEEFAESTVTAQKILSCIYRVDQRFGVGHVVDVLLGANTERIRQFRHDQLTTYALLKGMDKKSLTNLVHQLIDLGLLDRTPGDMPTLKLNPASWEVLRNQRPVRLIQPRVKGVKKTDVDTDSWVGVDRGLFERLRILRRDLSQQRAVPAYLIFGDATLRELARVRPRSVADLDGIRGIGRRKSEELGDLFVKCINDYCRENNIPQAGASSAKPPPASPPKRLSEARQSAFAMFERGSSIADVAKAIDRAVSTTVQYLVEFILAKQPVRIDAWVSDETYARVAAAAEAVAQRKHGDDSERVGPVHEELKGSIPHDAIRLVLRHLSVRE